MKVAIVGTSGTTFFNAPYDHEEWEIWSLNGAFEKIPRYTRWFEFHTWAQCVDEDLSDGYKANLKKTASEGRLYTVEPFPDCENYKRFPKEDVIKTCGEYFTSSIAWMIGLAIHEGATDIGLWGIDMAGKHEYTKQRSCCEYLLGFARGRGINIALPPKCPLLKGPLYYDDLMGELQNLSDTAEDECNKHRDNMNYNRGIADAVQRLQHRWG